MELLPLANQPDIEQQQQIAQWVKGAQEGSLSAFEALFRTFERRIYALCMRMCSNTALAEELTQEAFIQAWRKIGSFNGDSQFGTWLHRVASNQVISYFRVKKNTLFSSTDYDEPADTEVHQNYSLSRDLEAAVASLPEKARLVLVLHDVEGFAHHEIADQMSISVGTCKAQLHRARKLLRERLQ
ncbi:MAG: sigma-70 family RNA polymerase sigma factor [Kangiellaceae bacterium]|nr:sigma-70 family RNA polymerase sigma factor [Kangiellaceae bacterium]